MTETEGKRKRGRPLLREEARLPPPRSIRLTDEQFALVDEIYERDPRKPKSQITREIFDAGVKALGLEKGAE